MFKYNFFIILNLIFIYTILFTTVLYMIINKLTKLVSLFNIRLEKTDLDF